MYVDKPITMNITAVNDSAAALAFMARATSFFVDSISDGMSVRARYIYM